MDSLVRELLEEYLAGTLRGARKTQLETHLAKNPKAAVELEQYEQASALLAALRLPEDELVAPEPGFYARVMQCVEQQRESPFWMLFLEPLFIRRLAFASLMWFALMGTYVASFEAPSGDANARIAESMLVSQPPSEYYRVRFGTNLEQNRNSMLAVVMTSGD
jgi:anti-sigma factor RsiW